VRAFVAIIICFLLSGCVKEQKWSGRDVSEYEARLSDVAIPLYGKPIKKLLSPQTFVYTAEKDIQQLRLFYEQEMERLGWDLLAADNNQETLLIFNKPHKISSVSIRGIGKRKQVHIAILHKK